MFHPEPPAGALLPSTPRLPVRTHAPIISVFEVQVNKLTVWLGIVDLLVRIVIMDFMDALINFALILSPVLAMGLATIVMGEW